jgi:hypothetical protein
VRRRQVTRTSRPHSKKWRASGCYLPSKWSGWTVRKRRQRAKRPADPTWELPARPEVSANGALCPPLPPSDERVQDPALSPFRAGFSLLFAVARSQIEPTAKLRNDTLLPFVSVGLRPGANLSNASLNEPISIVIAERLQFHLDRENLPEEAADLVRIAQAGLAEAAEVVEESAGVP